MTTDKLLNQAMLMLAEDPQRLFIGQNVRYDGNVIYRTLEGVPDAQRIEWPVAEEMQLGACIGLSLQGFRPVSIFPRMDFLLRAADQIVLHLDKLAEMTVGRFRPKVIIRTRVGSKTPLNAGPQHTNDLTEAFKAMLRNVAVRTIDTPEQIMGTYRAAMNADYSTLVVERL